MTVDLDTDSCSSVTMMTDRHCKIDLEDEKYFDSLQYPALFLGCDKTLPCHVFHLCRITYSGMQNLGLVVGVLAIMAAVFWLLHQCLNDMGCADFCAQCGICSNQCHRHNSDQCNGHKSDRKKKEKECESCVRRRAIVRHKVSTSTSERAQGRRVSVIRPGRCCEHPAGPTHSNPPLCLWIQANLAPHVANLVPGAAAPDAGDRDIHIMDEAPGVQDVVPPHLRSASNLPAPSGSHGTPNSYVVADSPRPSGSRCNPTSFAIRSVFDTDLEEEQERKIPVHIS